MGSSTKAENSGSQKIRTGCISWTYPDWKGSFYPAAAKTSELLALYSNVFDLVEVDSSFYRTPTVNMVAQWRERTPKQFLFTVKLPKRITHELKLQSIDKDLHYFEDTVSKLGHKLACVFVQLSPFMKYEKYVQSLKDFLPKLHPDIRYAIEFRDPSWFREETSNLLSENKVCIVWSVSKHIESQPTPITTDFTYLRFMGDFNELVKFDRIQKDKTAELKEWCGKLKNSLGSVNVAYVLCGNRYAGFAPSTTNEFRRIAGLKEINWQARMSNAPSESGPVGISSLRGFASDEF